MKNLRIFFNAEQEGLYLIEISARAKSEKQVSENETDDDDLRIEIDGRKFSKLDNFQRYFDPPAAFSGGQLHNLEKTVVFFIQLSKGKHVISFISDNNPLCKIARFARYFAQWAAVPASWLVGGGARDIAQLSAILNFCRQLRCLQKLRIAAAHY